LCILCTSGWPGRRNGISKTGADYENRVAAVLNWQLETGNWKLEAGSWELETGSRELVRVHLASDKIDA